MKYRRKKQLTIILILVAVISSISIGFAAFSATLNISSSASVTPNSSSFYLGFYPSDIPSLDDGTISPSTTGGATGNNITVDAGSTTITGLKADFTEPGQTITYSFYVGNESEYDSYLNTINFLNVSGQSKNKVCTPGAGTTASLVDATCEAITMTVEVNGTTANSTTATIFGNSLIKGAFVPVNVTIRYAENGARADGPFTVEFGGISLDYSTVDYFRPTNPSDDPNAVVYYLVSILSEGPGTVEGVTTVKEGDTTKLYAIPSENAKFIGWTIKGEFEIAQKDNEINLLELFPYGNITVTASFSYI